MKKSMKFFLIGIITFIIVVLSFYNFSVNKKYEYNTLLEINKDIPLLKSLEKLEISKTLPFKIHLKIRDGGRGIKAGYYEIKGMYSLKEVINILESGSSKVEKITIPEGYSLKNIIKIYKWKWTEYIKKLRSF